MSSHTHLLRQIPSFQLKKEGYSLRPYHKTEGNIQALKDILSDDVVYPTIGKGIKITEEEIFERHREYISANMAFEKGTPYDPDTFGLCWLLIENESNKIIGRGGFQEEGDLGQPYSEIFFAIKGEHQKKGLGSMAFSELLDWFEKNFPLQPLLWLSMPENIKSIRIAEKLGFSSFINNFNHNQLKIPYADKEFLVFIRNH